MVVHSYPVEDTVSDKEESNILFPWIPSYLKVLQYIHRGFTVVAELTKWQQRVVLHSWFEVNIIWDTVNTIKYRYTQNLSRYQKLDINFLLQQNIFYTVN